jgi:hypothetical protein
MNRTDLRGRSILIGRSVIAGIALVLFRADYDSFRLTASRIRVVKAC